MKVKPWHFSFQPIKTSFIDGNPSCVTQVSRCLRMVTRHTSHQPKQSTMLYNQWVCVNMIRSYHLLFCFLIVCEESQINQHKHKDQ